MRRSWIGLWSIGILFGGLLFAEEGQMITYTGTVSGPGESPVAGAQAELYLLTVDHASMRYHIAEKGRTQTDAEGKFTFTFESQASGGYAIYCCLVKKEGLSCGWGTIMPDGGTVFTITLTEPQKMIGFVTTPDGEPVADAEVRLVVLALPGEGDQIMFGMDPVTEFATKTCGDGRFDFNNLPDKATAEFLVCKPGMGTLVTVTSGRSPSDGFTYAAGQMDIRLTLQEGFKLSGRVVTQDDNKPVAGVPVSAMNSQMPVNLLGDPAASAADGTFAFSDLAPGEYRVAVMDEDWICEPETISISDADVGDAVLQLTKGGTIEITVVDSATEERISGAQVQFRNEGTHSYQGAMADESGVAKKQMLPGTYQISAYGQGYRYAENLGTVVVENNKTAALTVQLGGQAKVAGVVLSPDGKPVAGADVRIFPHSGGRDNTTTDEKGQFKLGWDPEQMGWTEGEFYLVVTAADEHLAGVELIGVDTEAVSIKLQKGTSVSGRVMNEKQEPIAGARMQLYFHGSRFSSPIGKDVVTDGDGRYTFAPLSPEQRYSVHVIRAEGYGTGRKDVTPALGASVIQAEDIGLRVADRKLSGTVVDVDDKPIANVNLHCYGEGQPNLNCTADAEGKFAFASVCPGEIRINAHYQSGSDYMYANVRTEGGVEDVKVVLAPQGGSRYVPKQPPSLAGKPLPALSDCGVTVPADANSILVFAWDMHQRPSRHFVKQLAEKAAILAEHQVTVLLVNTAAVDQDTLAAWLIDNGIDYPCDVIGKNAEDVKFNMGIRSLPWLILTDAEHTVIAEGFTMETLEEKLKAL